MHITMMKIKNHQKQQISLPNFIKKNLGNIIV